MRVIKVIIKALPFAYMVFIWVLSSLPHNAVVEFSVADSLIKESLHLVEFAILYLFFVGYLLVDGKLTKKSNLIVALSSMLYGVVDEIHQYFVPYRSATLIDIIKDFTGVMVCYWIVVQSYFLQKSKLGNFMLKAERYLSNV